MKKLIISLVCALGVISAYADTQLYTAWCGAQTYTVEDSDFEDESDAEEYFEILDEILCGPRP